LAEDCEVQLTYTIGQAKPISIQVDTFDTGTIPDHEIEKRIRKHFDLRPAVMVKTLGLQHLPAKSSGRFYRDLAAYGHMGREDLEAPWEQLDRVDLLKD
jgi:S-adenosylmethionine synthetase